jgi:elongation factor Ts
MPKITVSQIKKLREETNYGVMECRQALVESGGDMKKAKQWLDEKSVMKAQKKASREVKSGLVEAYAHATGKVAAIVEVACETDFVAKTDQFKKLCRELAMQVASMNPKNVKELLAQEYIRDATKTVEQLVKETIGVLGENIVVRRFVRVELGEK